MTFFLGDLAIGPQSLIPVIAVTLSLMIPIVAIIVDHFQKKAKMRLVEKAIEHGLDPKDINLDMECHDGPRLPYRAGMVTFAVGIALVVAARFAYEVSGILVAFATIGGVICILVGVALIINDWMNRDRIQEANDARKVHRLEP